MTSGLWILLTAGVVAVAAVPAGYSHWNSEQLQDRLRGLPAKMGKVKVATEGLGGWGNHSMSVVHREGSGEAELHETQSDILFIRSGEAAIIVGGTIPNRRRTTAHEIRGAKIEGGERQPLRPGDILHIAPGTPHQIILDPGQKLDYYAVKISAR
ncbi:MAG TPA: AraC family ligand binding domain-containing protein [Bryobacteraceae bacterium]|jgi:mannose-6-phosphate isomerase-like protein (cupin superfamily)|nr:AraC family ligand binding domain-containing protein [Bryobacteraceae bacterium]